MKKALGLFSVMAAAVTMLLTIANASQYIGFLTGHNGPVDDHTQGPPVSCTVTVDSGSYSGYKISNVSHQRYADGYSQSLDTSGYHWVVQYSNDGETKVLTKHDSGENVVDQWISDAH